MADKSSQLILDALSRAASHPAGAPLHGNKNAPGLFAATAPAREAAQQCKQSDYLRVLRSEARGKSTQEICTLTEKGLSHLLSQGSPRQTLEELVRTLQTQRGDIGALVAAAHQLQATLDVLRITAEKVVYASAPKTDINALYSQWLGKSNGTGDRDGMILKVLEQWHGAGGLEDCPLAELFRRVQAPSLTIGQFHDALRRLVEKAQIYLHPWTGPLSELPEPPCALMVGHEIAYYASIRK